MCKAQDYSEQLLEIYNNINTEVRRLCAEVNTADLYDMDMLHIIENTNFNACDGFKLAKSIKENRTFRRQIKNELETMKQLKNNFIDKNMELLNQTHQEVIRRDVILTGLTEHKVYNPRVLGKENVSPVVHRPTPVKTDIVIGKAIHKKTKEEIQVISELENKYFVVKRLNGKQEVMNGKSILNLESLMSAK
jgi:hypothetical protein